MVMVMEIVLEIVMVMEMEIVLDMGMVVEMVMVVIVDLMLVLICSAVFIRELAQCHRERSVAKFFGVCNDAKAALDQCMKREVMSAPSPSPLPLPSLSPSPSPFALETCSSSEEHCRGSKNRGAVEGTLCTERF